MTGGNGCNGGSGASQGGVQSGLVMLCSYDLCKLIAVILTILLSCFFSKFKLIFCVRLFYNVT
jgi:hypothetical protein